MQNNIVPSEMQNDLTFILRNNLMAFAEATFLELHPQATFVDSYQLSLLAAKLEECFLGTCKRLIICLPPRHLKSILASVAFPAWVLGRAPHMEVICASYGQDLADKHARDTRAIMSTGWYQNAFSTRLSPQKNSVNDFMTTAGGSRMATSIGGVLTGRGADILIIDDPLKPGDALSESLRKSVNDWYDNTLRSRLNNKQEGVIIIVMQRLHQDDLVGHLLENESWDVVKFPAIAEEDEFFTAESLLGPVRFERKAGQVLDPRRETLQSLEQLRYSMGSYSFEAQYQQNPQPVGGAIIKTAWLGCYGPDDVPKKFSYYVQSWDTAMKSGEMNDYSVCTTWGVFDKKYYLVDVFRKRLEYPELRRAVMELYRRYFPRTVLIEDKGSGSSLLQDYRREIEVLKAYCPPPGNDKAMRLHAQSAVFENGRVFLPKNAPWLGEYIRELTSFPGSKHDDQVDSTTQALDHMTNGFSNYLAVHPFPF